VEPDVIKRSWARIAEDVRAATNRQLVVELRPGSNGWWDINAYLDGNKVRGGGRVLSAENEEELVAELADTFQEEFLDEEI
jgi:hypothetical protein